MTTYHSPEQASHVTEFMDEFIKLISWLKTPEGVDMLADKCTLDNGDINEEAMLGYVIKFVMDKASAMKIEPGNMHALIAGSVLSWACEGNYDYKQELAPIYREYLK